MSEIVNQAMLHTLTDIGQLSATERKELNRAVKAGLLDKGRGGPFPIVKTVYAPAGFNFAADRAAWISYMMSL